MRAVYAVIVRMQVTRGRAAGLGALVAVGLLVAIAVRSTDGADVRDAYALVDSFGLGLLVPVGALVFASAALGDPVEDRTLVYLWLRPLARWRLAVGAFLATLTLVAPFAVAPSVAVSIVAGGDRRLALATAAAAGLAVLAYGALFLCLGLVVRRALAWGLAYVLIWEGFVARSGTGAARLSVLGYARSVLARVADQELPRLAAAQSVAVAVPLAVAVAAVAATTWWLRRTDVA